MKKKRKKKNIIYIIQLVLKFLHALIYIAIVGPLAILYGLLTEGSLKKLIYSIGSACGNVFSTAVSPVYMESNKHFDIAEKQLLKNNYDLAIENFEMSYSINITNLKALMRIADIYIEKQDYVLAEKYCSKALAVKPDYKEGIEKLTKIKALENKQ